MGEGGGAGGLGGPLPPQKKIVYPDGFSYGFGDKINANQVFIWPSPPCQIFVLSCHSGSSMNNNWL